MSDAGTERDVALGRRWRAGFGVSRTASQSAVALDAVLADEFDVGRALGRGEHVDTSVRLNFASVADDAAEHGVHQQKDGPSDAPSATGLSAAAAAPRLDGATERRRVPAVEEPDGEPRVQHRDARRELGRSRRVRTARCGRGRRGEYIFWREARGAARRGHLARRRRRGRAEPCVVRPERRPEHGVLDRVARPARALCGAGDPTEGRRRRCGVCRSCCWRIAECGRPGFAGPERAAAPGPVPVSRDEPARAVGVAAASGSRRRKQQEQQQ